MAFVGLGDGVGRGGRAGDVDTVAGPLIAGHRSVAVVERAVDRGQQLTLLRGAGDRGRGGEGQGDVADRGGRRTGRGRAGAAVAVGGGLDDAQDMAFVGFGDGVGRGGRARDVDTVAGPLIAGHRSVAVVERAVDGAQRLSFLRGAADRGRGGEGQGDVADRGGRRTGRGRAGAAIAVGGGLDDAQDMAFVGFGDGVGGGGRAGDVDPVAGPLIAGHRSVVVVGGGRLDLDREALVALGDQVGRAGADRGGVVVGRAVPGVADRVVGLPGRSGGGQRLAFLRGAADH